MKQALTKSRVWAEGIKIRMYSRKWIKMKSMEREAYLPGSGNTEGSSNNGSGLGGSAYVLPFCLFFLALFFFALVLCLLGFSLCFLVPCRSWLFPPWPSLAFIKPEDDLCFFEKKQGNDGLLPWFLSVFPCSGRRRW